MESSNFKFVTKLPFLTMYNFQDKADLFDLHPLILSPFSLLDRMIKLQKRMYLLMNNWLKYNCLFMFLINSFSHISVLCNSQCKAYIAVLDFPDIFVLSQSL